MDQGSWVSPTAGTFNPSIQPFPLKRPASPCRAVVGALRLVAPLSAGPPRTHAHTHTHTQLGGFCVCVCVCFGLVVVGLCCLFCVGMEPCGRAVGLWKMFIACRACVRVGVFIAVEIGFLVLAWAEIVGWDGDACHVAVGMSSLGALCGVYVYRDFRPLVG